METIQYLESLEQKLLIAATNDKPDAGHESRDASNDLPYPLDAVNDLPDDNLDGLSDSTSDPGVDPDPSPTSLLNPNTTNGQTADENDEADDNAYYPEWLVGYKDIINTDEWYWIRSMSKHFPTKARKMKRIVNVYNVSRQIMNKKKIGLQGIDDSKFRRKLIKAVVLAEMWPQKMAWIMQIADDVLAIEKLEKKRERTYPYEEQYNEKELYESMRKMELNKLVRKIHKLMGDFRMDDANRPPYYANGPIETIFKDVPLAIVYRVIVEPLMHSVSDTSILSGREGDIKAFESLLEDFDVNLLDKLTLSDVYPLDYCDDFNSPKIPSLRPYMFNMQEYYLDKASSDMSQMIFHCNMDACNLSYLNLTCARKSDRYLRRRPIHPDDN